MSSVKRTLKDFLSQFLHINNYNAKSVGVFGDFVKSIKSITKLDVGYVIIWSDGEIEYLTAYELEERTEKLREIA